MESEILRDIIILFGLSIGVILFFHKLKLPPIVGFLITGVVAGPQGLQWIGDLDKVRIFAEIGIVLLLFTLGLEFSAKKILKFSRAFFLAGPIQVSLTCMGGMAAGLIAGREWKEAIFLGFLLSLSSTAIVVRIFQERSQTHSPQGQLCLGVLIFQDMIAIPMMLLIPFLSTTKGTAFDFVFLAKLFKGLAILGLTFWGAFRLMPHLMFQVAKTRSRELFLLTVLLVCFSVAWLASYQGLSLALGAFLAGLLIAESEYSTQAIGDVIPFLDVFTSFFFVSIGMLLDLEFLYNNFLVVLALTGGVIVFKTAAILLTGLLNGFSLRTALLSGMAMSQVGEFSFVLAMSGMRHQIGTEYLNQLFIAVAVVSMGLTPFLILASPRTALFLSRFRIFHTIWEGAEQEASPSREYLEGHVIIAGFGFIGKNLARSSKSALIPYVIIDLNPETVRIEKAKGEPIYFGDATRGSVLQRAAISKAKVLAVMVNDPIAAMHIVKLAKSIHPALYIIVRARNLEEMKALFQVGADDVIPDELGTAVEIFTRVLLKYDIPFDHIEQFINVLRNEGYELIKPHYSGRTIFSDLTTTFPEVNIKTVQIKEGSFLDGKTLEESELRRKYRLTVLAINRGSDTIYQLEGGTFLLGGDQIVLAGTKEAFAVLTEMIE